MAETMAASCSGVASMSPWPMDIIAVSAGVMKAPGRAARHAREPGSMPGIFVWKFDAGFLAETHQRKSIDHALPADCIGHLVEIRDCRIAGWLRAAGVTVAASVLVPEPASDLVIAVGHVAVTGESVIRKAFERTGDGGRDLHGRARLEGGDRAIGKRRKLRVGIVGDEFLPGNGRDEGVRIVVGHGCHRDHLAGADVHHHSRRHGLRGGGCFPKETECGRRWRVRPGHRFLVG